MIAALEPKDAHLERAKRALPGPVYLAVLVWIHRLLRPATYVEIGVADGESLRAAQPGTRCIGIDPAPRIDKPLNAPARLFSLTSDEFFARHDLGQLLDGGAFSLAFIDGLHLFEQALRDFIHLEQHAASRSIVLLHDCVPLDGETSARTRTTEFYSGDVWKLALCLRETRPDLRMVVVPTPPTGLCIVSGLDAGSRVLAREYDACVRRYAGLTFDDCRRRRGAMPPAIPNTKAALWAYLTEEIKR
jgi:hypothetical protein